MKKIYFTMITDSGRKLTLIVNSHDELITTVNEMIKVYSGMIKIDIDSIKIVKAA
jgi:hypothetical protein